MGYRHDTPYRFCLRTGKGDGSDVLKLLEGMPHDHTVKVTAWTATPHPDLEGDKQGACLEVTFTSLYEKKWVSPTYDFLVALMKRLDGEKTDFWHETGLFTFEPTDYNAMTFGVKQWVRVDIEEGQV